MLAGLLQLAEKRLVQLHGLLWFHLGPGVGGGLLHRQRQQFQAVQVAPHVAGDGLRRDVDLFQRRQHRAQGERL